MPEIFHTDVRADQLRAGKDLIIRTDNQLVGVTSRTSKAKWTEITLVTGTTMRVENGSAVRVQRERPTAEEAAQAELEGKLFFLDLTEQRAVKDLADAQRQLAKSVADNDWNVATRMQNLLEAKAVHEVWMRVQQAHLNSATREGLEPITRLEAYAYVVDKLREELIDFSRWSSRSTSTWHNAVEDIERDAKSRFLRDAKWNVQL